MKRLAGTRPNGAGSKVPSHGRNCELLPLLSFCHRPCSVSEVAALGRQVSDGAITLRSSGTWSTCESDLRCSAINRYDSEPSAFSGPVRSACSCLRPKLPNCTPTSRWASCSGRLLTMLTTPAAVPAPNSMPAGPRSTSRRSSV
ncbi:hypothetical protein D9M69_534970 [compost metagenome]